MKILVTGPNGFLGSHVVDALLAHGHELRLLTRSTSKVRFLTDDAGVERIEGDVRHPESLLPAVQGVDAVVHVAGLVSSLSRAEYDAVNARGTQDLVQAARGAGVQRFVYVSSLAAQGPSPDGRPRPPEPSLPISPYGRSKLAGEYAVRTERHRMNVSILRLPVIYGPRDRGLLPFFKMADLGFLPLYGDGSHRLSWLHIHDTADLIVTALEKSERTGTIYTACDGDSHSWRELAQMLGDAMGSNLRLINVPPGLYAAAGAVCEAAMRLTKVSLPLTSEKVLEMSQRYWVCDNETARSELGWQPSIGPEEGLLDTVRWYRANRWL